MNRWQSFSLNELEVLEDVLGRMLSDEEDHGLYEDVEAAHERRREEKAKARATSECLAAAAEAVRRSDTGQVDEGAVARRAETHALRDAVRAIIQHLEERP